MNIQAEDDPRSIPYQQEVRLLGHEGRDASGMATVDGGGMVNVLDWVWYDARRMALGKLKPSRARARVANGAVLESIGRWIGPVCLGPVTITAGFEVFDSRGSFEVLLGKPWLSRARLAQDFADDTLVWADSANGSMRIPNANLRLMAQATTDDQRAQSPSTLSSTGTDDAPSAPPSPQCPPPARDPLLLALERETGMRVDTDEEEQDAEQEEEEAKEEKAEPRRRRSRGAKRREELEHERLEEAVLEEAMKKVRTERSEAADALLALWQEPDGDAAGGAPPGTEPWQQVVPELMMLHERLAAAKAPDIPLEERLAPERVQRVLDAVRIGNDLSPEESEGVRDLVKEFADVFTLELSEVRLVDFIEHKLGIPKGTVGPRVANQKPLTEPQREWLYGALDEMEACDVIRRIPASAAKWVSSITLAPKDKGRDGLTMDELRRRANEECVRAGMPPMWEEVATSEDLENRVPPSQGGIVPRVVEPPAKAKWRLCHSFIGLNRVSQHSSFPMGDLHAKHKRAAGHRWVCVADFMAGFNAVPLAQDDIGYTAFAIPGRGLYVTPRMCFGLTGAPNTFCEMVSLALDGLTGDIVEPWMDDCALWGDEFRELMGKLRAFFMRCRERKLSLAASKTVLFQTEAIFAGARISAAGVAPVLTKVSAILDWPEPKNAHEVLGFTSLVGHFRPIIRNFARIAKPLTDLTRDVRAVAPTGGRPKKGAYKRALLGEDVSWKWGRLERESFLKLKVILTTDPVLKPPQYDRPFIVTTDGSKSGFGATLTQRWTVKDETGNDVEREFPVEFASKRTSRTEERYTPYVLEFAALKFALDKFDSTVFGQPIELVTDCRALRDTLNSDDLSSTHTRWMESVIARQIVDVRHRPGVDNHTDGLSRMWTSYEDRSVADGDKSVLPDWESRDLAPDVFSILEAGDSNDKLRQRFANDAYFTHVVEWLTALRVDPALSESQARRARYRARDYVVQDGKLWRVGGKDAHRSPRVECLPRAEGQARAAECHEHGHWGRDICVESLRTQYFWPDMRRDVVAAIQDCSPCKGFGTRHVLSQLQPITRSRPFQMIVGDYLSLPNGRGGFQTVLLLVDVFSRFVWGFKSTKKAGTGAFTVKCLEQVCNEAGTPELFGTDGGRHFDCAEVRQFCESRGIEYTKTPPYSPWANGLVEECNRTLLGRLRRYCHPDFVADETEMSLDELKKQTTARWPEYFARAIADMNSRILPSLGYSPRELLFGLVRSDGMAPVAEPADADSAAAHLADTDATRSDAHARTVEHANARKARFDKTISDAEFTAGDIVQVYQDRLDNTFATSAKLAARWSGPMRVISRYVGSWKVRELGEDEGGLYVSGRRLRLWVPTRGTALEKEVKERAREKALGRAGQGETVGTVGTGRAGGEGEEQGLEGPSAGVS